MTSDTWGQVKDALRNTVGQNNFVTWIEPLEFLSFENGVAEFQVATSFQGDWVSRNFGEQIKYQISKLGHDVSRLTFSVPRRTPAAQKLEAAKPQAKKLATIPPGSSDALLGAPTR